MYKRADYSMLKIRSCMFINNCITGKIRESLERDSAWLRNWAIASSFSPCFMIEEKMNESFCFTHGNIDDFFLLLDEVIEWCAATNKNMWRRDEIDREKLINSVGSDAFIVLKNGPENVAGMILQWHDPVFWPLANPNEAGYIHKLCVSRKYSGMNISKHMIRYAIEKCKSNQVKYLRLDTGADRTKLRTIYESNGIVLMGYMETNGRKYCLYELQIK